MEKQKKKQHQIKIELDDNVGQGEYVNLAIVTHSPAEFVMDFIRVLPGMTKSKVKSRIIMAPMHAKTLMMALQDNIRKYEPALSTLNYFAATADNPKLLSADIDRNMNGNYSFWAIVDLFEQAGLLKKRGRVLIFPDEKSRFMVNGGWLEMYAYACCLDLKRSKGIQDVSHSVEVSRKQGGNTVLNEIDVALLKDNALYLLECKTKHFNGHSKKHSEGADVLYKLDSIRDVLGGTQAKAMLVSYKKLEHHHLDRAKELDIEVCCYQNLKFLKEKIEFWLNKRAWR